jgi:predicted transcriptional regulator
MTDGKKLLSDELLHQVEEAARAQNRKPAELLQEAVQKYLEELSWQAFVGKAEERNRAKGVSEMDVPRLIDEVRRENRDRGR